ncbi:MAG: NAD(P)H-hydrate dehydratase [Sphingobium sp.]
MAEPPILTAVQMRAAEQAVFDGGVPEYALMERAGAAAAEMIWRAGHRRDTLILCGPGNNGGDGYVIARLLAERGVPVRVAALGESSTNSSQRARSAWTGPVEALDDAAAATQLVDALFGTGLSRGLDPAVAMKLRTLVEAAGHSYAIDLPSGVETDTGALLSDVPRFDLTIALGAYKPAHHLQPAAARARRLVCADIGLGSVDGAVRVLEAPDLAPPTPDSHKYTRGLVAVVEGVMPGAAMLAAAAAARSGAGYVKLVGSGRRGRIPLAIVQTPDEEALVDGRVAAMLVGPGLGRGTDRARAALAPGHAAVVDADALIGLDLSLLPERAILTPHEGEFIALFGALPGSKIDRALAAAARAEAVIVYKGADSVIAAPDGRCAVARTASSWLSTAGTGDVLAGICAARLAVTGDPFRAACEAVWLHGDVARRAGSAFVADDLIERLPAAIASRL